MSDTVGNFDSLGAQGPEAAASKAAFSSSEDCVLWSSGVFVRFIPNLSFSDGEASRTLP